MKVVWVVINATHYHISRWKAFSQRASFDSVILEIANRDAGFDALAAANTKVDGFDRRTLFPGRTWVDVSGHDRRKAIQGALDELMPDIICLNGWSIGGAIASLQWAKMHDRRTVLIGDSNRFDHSRNKALEWLKKRIVTLADSGLAAGTSSRAYMMDLGMPFDRVSVGYDVVDNLHFAALDLDREPSRPVTAPINPYFIAAGRFESKKNHLRLLRAFAKYRQAAGKNAWSMVLLGDGVLRREIEALSVELGLEDSLVLPGFVEYNDLPRWYCHASCFVHPSTTEQWGLVVNEAMAAGLPVLVSERCGCAPDLVESGENGFTFNPYDVDELASLMWHVTSSCVDLEAMKAASLDIIKRWSPETFALGLELAIQAALANSGRKPDLLDWALLRALSYR